MTILKRLAVALRSVAARLDPQDSMLMVARGAARPEETGGDAHHNLGCPGSIPGIGSRSARPRSPADDVDEFRRELEAEARAEFGLRNVQFSPDPASPGDVWPRQSEWTPMRRALRRVK